MKGLVASEALLLIGMLLLAWIVWVQQEELASLSEALVSLEARLPKPKQSTTRTPKPKPEPEPGE